MAFAKTTCLVAVVVLAIAGQARANGSEDPELKAIEDLFTTWNDALQTGDPDNVAALYATDGVLLPTVSNEVRYDNAGKVDYFEKFLKLKPSGTINEHYARFLNAEKDVAANSGIYTFAITDEDGEPQEVQARFSYVYAKDPATGEWKIVEHHSSAMPENTADLDEIAALFDEWNAALQTGEPEKVVDLYAEESVLLPTLSNVPRTDRAGKLDYFESFLTKKPFGTINEANIRFLDEEHTSAINSGIYTFAVEDAEGKVMQVPARFTYVYKMNPETHKWEIVEHHSSAMPEEEAPPVGEAAGRKLLRAHMA